MLLGLPKHNILGVNRPWHMDLTDVDNGRGQDILRLRTVAEDTTALHQCLSIRFLRTRLDAGIFPAFGRAFGDA